MTEITPADQMFKVLSVLMSRKEQIQKALDRQHGEGFTFDHVFEMVMQKRAAFFWNEHSSAVIEIRPFPNEVTVHVFLAAGTLPGLLDLYEHVAIWGKTIVKASRMTTLGRIGFKRALKKYGWTEPQAWLVKEI